MPIAYSGKEKQGLSAVKPPLWRVSDLPSADLTCSQLFSADECVYEYTCRMAAPQSNLLFLQLEYTEDLAVLQDLACIHAWVSLAIASQPGDRMHLSLAHFTNTGYTSVVGGFQHHRP